jgi:hypothetical protein
MILKHLTRFFDSEDIFAIATNMEQFFAFEISGFRFLDSLQFLNCSLETLAHNLPKDKFTNMRHLYAEDDEFNLLIRKGVYPYEYMDSPDRMSDTRLPEKEAFYSRLTDEYVTHADYQHAQTVWTKFGMRSMRDYHDLYLKTDVIWQTFLKNSAIRL